MTPILAIGLAVLAGGTLQPSGGTLRSGGGTFGAQPPATPFYTPPPAQAPYTYRATPSLAPPTMPQAPRAPTMPQAEPFRPFKGTSVYSPPAKPPGYVDFYGKR